MNIARSEGMSLALHCTFHIIKRKNSATNCKSNLNFPPNSDYKTLRPTNPRVEDWCRVSAGGKYMARGVHYCEQVVLPAGCTVTPDPACAMIGRIYVM